MKRGEHPVSLNYRQVMYWRYHNELAWYWWDTYVRQPTKRRCNGLCCFCGKYADKGDCHHTKEAYKYIGYEDAHLDLMRWCHRECHENYHQKDRLKKRFKWGKMS